MMKVEEIMEFLEKWVPSSLAESWDNVGLQCGDRKAEVTKIIIALDPSEKAIDYAITHKAELLVTHHPLFLSPIKNIIYSEPLGRIVQKVVSHKLNILALHTNLDSVPDGVSRILLEIIGAIPKGVIQPKYASNIGFGWWGELPEEMSKDAFIKLVEEKLDFPVIRIVGQKDIIKRIGVCGGSASNLLPLVVEMNLDAFILGELKYHPARLYEFTSLLILEVGHYESEKWVLHKIKEKLDHFLQNQKIETIIFYEVSPFKYYLRR